MSKAARRARRRDIMMKRMKRWGIQKRLRGKLWHDERKISSHISVASPLSTVPDCEQPEDFAVAKVHFRLCFVRTPSLAHFTLRDTTWSAGRKEFHVSPSELSASTSALAAIVKPPELSASEFPHDKKLWRRRDAAIMATKRSRNPSHCCGRKAVGRRIRVGDDCWPPPPSRMS